MNRKYISLLIGAACCAGVSYAQTWTLDSCINYAVSHNLTVKSRELSAVSGELDIIEAKDRFLPTVAAGASQSFSFGRGLTAENTYANRNTSNFGVNAGLTCRCFRGSETFAIWTTQKPTCAPSCSSSKARKTTSPSTS